ARNVVRIRFPHFRLSHQEEVGIVAGQPLVERRSQTLARSRGLHQMRRDDDDQIGLVLLIVHAAEQSPQNWNRSQPRNLGPEPQIVGLQQAGNRKALAITQLDCCNSIALINDGTMVPEICTALVKSSSLTSGAIRRLIRPFCRTVGVKDSRTPKGLYSIVGV